jgi:16S rRNA pseudouridine516 synthase
MRIAQILFSQGFGSRRVCAGLLERGEVQVSGQMVEDPNAEFDTEGLLFHVDGQPWPFFGKAVVALHKPAGFECSQKPRHHPSVLSLLPQPLRQRGLQPVGRLDEDTTGLLLLTDDGTLIHRLTSPKWHVPKVYEAGCRHPVDDAQVQALLAGVVLQDDPVAVKAVACRISGERSLQMTLTDGRYHQVKRMLAAVGNRIESLHRSALGGFTLPSTLASGAWMWLGPAEQALLGGPRQAAGAAADPAAQA